MMLLWSYGQETKVPQIRINFASSCANPALPEKSSHKKYQGLKGMEEKKGEIKQNGRVQVQFLVWPMGK